MQPEPLKWLWPGRVPLEKLTLVAGDPGLGKSFLTLDMAARVSTGSGWPDDFASGQPDGSVVILNAEDDLEDTIRVRLDRAGANVKRIIAFEGMRTTDPDDGTSGRHEFSLRHGIEALASEIGSLGDCRLVIIDPISAYCGTTDTHKNSDVRGCCLPSLS